MEDCVKKIYVFVIFLLCLILHAQEDRGVYKNTSNFKNFPNTVYLGYGSMNILTYAYKNGVEKDDYDPIRLWYFGRLKRYGNFIIDAALLYNSNIAFTKDSTENCNYIGGKLGFGLDLLPNVKYLQANAIVGYQGFNLSGDNSKLGVNSIYWSVNLLPIFVKDQPFLFGVEYLQSVAPNKRPYNQVMFYMAIHGLFGEY